MRVLLVILVALFMVEPASALTLKGNVAPRHRAWAAASQAPLPKGPIYVTRNGCGFAWSCFDGALHLPKRTASFAQERAVLFHELAHAFDERHLSLRERGLFRHVTGMARCGWADECGGTEPREAFAEQYAACALGVPRALLAPELTFYDYFPSTAAESRVCAALWGWAR